MKLAFLIIDMQTIYLKDQVEEKAIQRSCEYINHVAGVIRSHNHLVVHVQDVEGINDSNRESYRIIPEIDVQQDDLIVTKEYSNAFWKTELEQVLSANGIKLVILSGFAAEHCVLFTYNGAIERGFKPILLQHGILSTNHEAILAANRDRHLISYPVIEFLAMES
ncbi:isochorismatase family cysteine hydrolase [Paenibacillus sp. LHD-117]|uniref:cysteine hydrolase family protein n=1 Tax=Paenibacillus sp. LHD-117 TaxID=3071412 RepID=UPI0027E097C6|nr:isochorismatase family cysteine hydrolase [Paenibacillus sp. LHD-117]MDQ6421759.1 isochorismatase family cysteine hydrolase [Paenibacillus sp. LHD-117]